MPPCSAQLLSVPAHTRHMGCRRSRARAPASSATAPGRGRSTDRSARRCASALGIEDRTASGCGYALTFDDGPHPDGTPAMLEILAHAGVRATFFLVGEQVRRNPALAGEIAAAGHEIGLHCDRHRNLLRLAPWQVRADIARARATIEDATGRAIGALPAAIRRAQRVGAAPGSLTWLADAAVEPVGARLGGACHARVDRRARHRRRRGGLGAAAPRRRRLLRAGLVAAHRRGAASVLDVLAERGLEPVAP